MRDPLDTLLYLLGTGFLLANLLILRDVALYLRRRPGAVLTWERQRAGVLLIPSLIAACLALVVIYKLLVLRWPVQRLFGEAMMLAYYGYLYPLAFKVRRGFYASGIWLDRGFVLYREVTGLTWRDDPEPHLIVIRGHRPRAGRLTVPRDHIAEARRILRDRISSDDLHFGHPLLDLGGHDEREDV